MLAEGMIDALATVSIRNCAFCMKDDPNLEIVENLGH